MALFSYLVLIMYHSLPRPAGFTANRRKCPNLPPTSSGQKPIVPYYYRIDADADLTQMNESLRRKSELAKLFVKLAEYPIFSDSGDFDNFPNFLQCHMKAKVR